MECTRWHTNQQAYLEVIWKENKTDYVICLHFGVYGNICGHMIPSSDLVHSNTDLTLLFDHFYLGYLSCNQVIHVLLVTSELLNEAMFRLLFWDYMHRAFICFDYQL